MRWNENPVSRQTNEIRFRHLSRGFKYGTLDGIEIC